MSAESDRYHDGAQAGYKVGHEAGYNQALHDVVRMMKNDFPDPNPLAHIFEPFVVTQIIEAIEEMKKG